MVPSQEALDLHVAALAARDAVDYRTVKRVAHELLALGESKGEPFAVAWGHHHLGAALLRFNDADRAEREIHAALAAFSAMGDRDGASRATMNLAMIELVVNVNAAGARRWFNLAMPAVREGNDPRRIARAYGNLGEICRLEGDYVGGLRNALESLRLFTELGDTSRCAWQLVNIAHFHTLMRNYDAATAAMKLAFERVAQDRNARWIAWYFDMLFVIAAKLGYLEVAAKVVGFADHWRDDHNIPRLQGLLPWISTPREQVARAMTHEALDKLMREGETLTFEQIQELAKIVLSRAAP